MVTETLVKPEQHESGKDKLPESALGQGVEDFSITLADNEKSARGKLRHKFASAVGEKVLISSAEVASKEVLRLDRAQRLAEAVKSIMQDAENRGGYSTREQDSDELIVSSGEGEDSKQVAIQMQDIEGEARLAVGVKEGDSELILPGVSDEADFFVVGPDGKVEKLASSLVDENGEEIVDELSEESAEAGDLNPDIENQ